MQRLSLDATAARREIERSDAAHAAIVRSFFGVDWQNPLIYHLVLNSGSVPIETCVTIVRLLADRPEFQETEETRSVLADKLVESRVRAALGDAFATPIDIRVAGGKVTLTGTTASHPRRSRTLCKTAERRLQDARRKPQHTSAAFHWLRR